MLLVMSGTALLLFVLGCILVAGAEIAMDEYPVAAIALLLAGGVLLILTFCGTTTLLRFILGW